MSFDTKCQNCGSKVSTTIEMIGYPVKCSMCGSEFSVPLTNFTTGMVSGNYWLQKCIGNGNISQTFVAKRMDDNEKVFLKILSPCVTLIHEDVEQFMIEMCRSHQIDHPNLISVYETGKMNGHYYLATRFVEGECLDKRIEETGPLSEKEALRLCLKIARILRSCWHDYGIVHRAIKPQNILVNDAGEVFLLDVGNCKQLLISETVPLERMDNLGTLGDYMSPEEAQGVIDVDCSSDIYSLGATLFFLLTGTKPYTGSDTTQVLLKHLNEPTPSVSQRSGDVSKKTAQFIRAMMDSNPDNRIYSWREVVAKLKGLLKGKTLGTGPDRVLKTQASTSTDFADEVRTTVMTPGPDMPKPFPTVKVAIIAMVTIMLLGIAAAIAIIVMNSKSNTPDPANTAPPSRDTGKKTGGGSRPSKGKTGGTGGSEDATFQKQIAAIRMGIDKGASSAKRQIKTIKGLISKNQDPSKTDALNGLLTQAQVAASQLVKVDLCELKVRNKGVNLENNDFEDKTFKGWKREGSGKMNLVGIFPHSKKFAVELHPASGFKQTISNVNGLENNTAELSIYAITKNDAEGILELRFLSADGSVIDKASTPLVDARAYQRFVVKKKAPKGSKSLEVFVGF